MYIAACLALKNRIGCAVVSHCCVVMCMQLLVALCTYGTDVCVWLVKAAFIGEDDSHFLMLQLILRTICNWRLLKRIEKKVRMSWILKWCDCWVKALKRVEITTLFCSVVYFLFTVLEWRTKCSMTLIAIRTTIQVKSGCPNFFSGSHYCLCVNTEFAFAIQAPRNMIASPDKKFNPCQ